MTPEDKALQLLDRFKFDFTTYWQEVIMHLHYIGTGELEAKSDRFNLN
jgi:hypothetical protein